MGGISEEGLAVMQEMGIDPSGTSYTLPVVELGWWESLMVIPLREMVFELFLITFASAFLAAFLLGCWWFMCETVTSNRFHSLEIRESDRQIAKEIIAERARRNPKR